MDQVQFPVYIFSQLLDLRIYGRNPYILTRSHLRLNYPGSLHILPEWKLGKVGSGRRLKVLSPFRCDLGRSETSVTEIVHRSGVLKVSWVSVVFLIGRRVDIDLLGRKIVVSLAEIELFLILMMLVPIAVPVDQTVVDRFYLMMRNGLIASGNLLLLLSEP